LNEKDFNITTFFPGQSESVKGKGKGKGEMEMEKSKNNILKTLNIGIAILYLALGCIGICKIQFQDN
jgi:hypothetical protein